MPDPSPNFGRADYDATIRTHAIPADEPKFILRAQDAVAADTVRLWATLAAQAGAAPPVLELALQQADAMEAWPKRKLPDAGELTAAEIKQLTYEYDRRAHRAGVDLAPDRAMEILLAERRGYAHALSALRVMHRALARLRLAYARRVEEDIDGCCLMQDDLTPLRPAPRPQDEAMIAAGEDMLAEADRALTDGARALARTGATPLTEPDWRERMAVHTAALEAFKTEQAAERAARAAATTEPERGFLHGLALSAWAGFRCLLIYIAGGLLHRVAQLPLTQASALVIIALTIVAAVNMLWIAADLIRWAIRPKRGAIAIAWWIAKFAFRLFALWCALSLLHDTPWDRLTPLSTVMVVVFAVTGFSCAFLIVNDLLSLRAKLKALATRSTQKDDALGQG